MNIRGYSSQCLSGDRDKKYLMTAIINKPDRKVDFKRVG